MFVSFSPVARLCEKSSGGGKSLSGVEGCSNHPEIIKIIEITKKYLKIYIFFISYFNAGHVHCLGT